MVGITNEALLNLVNTAYPGHEYLAEKIEFHARQPPLEDRVREDVAWLKGHPFVHHNQAQDNITGWIYDVDKLTASR